MIGRKEAQGRRENAWDRNDTEQRLKHTMNHMWKMTPAADLQCLASLSYLYWHSHALYNPLYMPAGNLPDWRMTWLLFFPPAIGWSLGSCWQWYLDVLLSGICETDTWPILINWQTNGQFIWKLLCISWWRFCAARLYITKGRFVWPFHSSVWQKTGCWHSIWCAISLGILEEAL
jgi:hypothetical protein